MRSKGGSIYRIVREVEGGWERGDLHFFSTGHATGLPSIVLHVLESEPAAFSKLAIVFKISH